MRVGSECREDRNVEGEGLGTRFWLGLAGVLIVGGIGLMILFFVIGHAFYAWGALGACVFISAVLLSIAWYFDRREQKRYPPEE